MSGCPFWYHDRRNQAPALPDSSWWWSSVRTAQRWWRWRAARPPWPSPTAASSTPSAAGPGCGSGIGRRWWAPGQRRRRPRPARCRDMTGGGSQSPTRCWPPLRRCRSRRGTAPSCCCSFHLRTLHHIHHRHRHTLARSPRCSTHRAPSQRESLWRRLRRPTQRWRSTWAPSSRTGSRSCRANKRGTEDHWLSKQFTLFITLFLFHFLLFRHTSCLVSGLLICSEMAWWYPGVQFNRHF